MIQWAAVTTQSLSMSTPPHQWPTLPACGCVNRIETFLVIFFPKQKS